MARRAATGLTVHRTATAVRLLEVRAVKATAMVGVGPRVPALARIGGSGAEAGQASTSGSVYVIVVQGCERLLLDGALNQVEHFH